MLTLFPYILLVTLGIMGATDASEVGLGYGGAEVGQVCASLVGWSCDGPFSASLGQVLVADLQRDLAGQEIEGRVPEGWTAPEMIRRLARLALDIMINGPVAAPQRLKGLEPGEWISLTPPSDGDPGSNVRVEFGGDYR